LTLPSSNGGALATVYGRLSEAARVDAEAVRRSLDLESRYLAERLLGALDVRGTGFASAAEFTAAAEMMMVAPVEEKIRFLFRMHDHDGDGRITREEFERMVHIGMAEQRLRVLDDTPERMVDAVFCATDRDGSDCLTYDEFVRMVSERPQMRDRLAANGVALLVPGRRAESKARPQPKKAMGWTSDRVVVGACVGLFALANVVAFVLAFLSYRAAGANIWIQIARGCGAMINLDTALILVPMLRGFLTWLRRRVIGRYLPIDESIDAHRLVGETLMGAAIVHTLAHIANIGASGKSWSTLLTGPWLTGMILFWLFVVMWVFARKRVRRSGDFELFHFSHLLYVPFFVVALAHGPVLWMWVAVPLAGYVVERIVRRRRARVASEIVAATPLPAGVTRLDIRRPHGFEYNAGDYAFIRIPAIARHEWHPFTITSAPEQADLLTFHVRALGNWTSALLRAADDGLGASAVHIDGPYGAPATHIADSEHAVAIAAGIGVTPFASILRSILMRLGGGRVRIRRLHFVWVSREQGSFSWFAELLARLEALDTMGILDIHIYMTQGRREVGGLDLVRDLDREAGGGDLVTGLAAKTTFGRPDFEALLAQFMAERGVAKPDVYFCGPPEVSRQLQKICGRTGLAYREERF
jgi:predicted ferric reductase/Ca2+-binding EF-hand superfamily protein